jgi:hypothetical protein
MKQSKLIKNKTMKRVFKFFIIISLVIIPMLQVKATAPIDRLSGKILLQVESHGEAWYVNPDNHQRYYMADGNAAFNVMRNLGIGITNDNLTKLQNNKNLAEKQSGKIFLQIQDKGEAYYVNSDGTLYYLKDGDAAYNIMRRLGLGITNLNLEKISSASSTDTSQTLNTNISPSSNNALCNGTNYMECPTGQDFVCPANGKAYCQSPSISNNQVCQNNYGIYSIWSGVINNQGEPTCVCNTGYEWNSGQNACVVKKTNDEICQDTYGIYSMWSGQMDNQNKILCSCQTGFVLSANNTSCISSKSDICQKALASFQSAENDANIYAQDNPMSLDEVTGRETALQTEIAGILDAKQQTVNEELQLLIQLNCPLQ